MGDNPATTGGALCMTYLGEGAFHNAGVAELVVPSTVTSFGRQQSPTMVKLDLSKTSFTYLEGYHFAYASALEDVALPATLTGMGDGAFTDCASLKRLVLPDGFTTIDDNWGYSFAGNTALTEVVWPVSLTDGSLFAEAPALKTIYYRGSELQWDLTASKDLLRGKEIIFNYEGE